MAKDDVGETLKSALAGVTIDCLINNSGIMGTSGSFPAQALQQIAMEDMRQTFEVNALGPLRVTKALAANLKSPGGKCVVILIRVCIGGVLRPRGLVAVLLAAVLPPPAAAARPPL